MRAHFRILCCRLRIQLSALPGTDPAAVRIGQFNTHFLPVELPNEFCCWGGNWGQSGGGVRSPPFAHCSHLLRGLGPVSTLIGWEDNLVREGTLRL